MDGREELILTPKEYALLSRLMLKEAVRCIGKFSTTTSITGTMNLDQHPGSAYPQSARQSGQSPIRTVRGFGYMLVANEEN